MVTLKPGYKTSELFLTVATSVGLILSAAADWLPPRYAAWGASLAAIGYAISRGLAKANPPKSVETVPGTPPPSTPTTIAQ